MRERDGRKGRLVTMYERSNVGESNTLLSFQVCVPSRLWVCVLRESPQGSAIRNLSQGTASTPPIRLPHSCVHCILCNYCCIFQLNLVLNFAVLLTLSKETDLCSIFFSGAGNGVITFTFKYTHNYNMFQKI